MKLQGRRQSGNVADIRTQTSAQQASAAVGGSPPPRDGVPYGTYTDSDMSGMAEQAGIQNMGNAAQRDHIKNNQSLHRTRWAGEQSPAPNAPASRKGGRVIEKIGIPTSDGYNKSRINY